jgi:hypothetical protein
MIISHNSKIIFIHIQRTGGSSIINLLKHHQGDNIEIIAQHGNARSEENYLLDAYPQYFTFSFVRNPWDRILSWYLLINKESQEKIEQEKIKFERFLNMNLAFKPNDPHFHYNQFDYISNTNGELITNKIYRFEHYDKEIQDLQKTLHFPVIEAHKMNTTWNRDYRNYYTKNSQELIAEKCKKDIEYFNYVF